VRTEARGACPREHQRIFWWYADALKIRAKKGANYVHDEWKFEVTAKDLNAMTEMRMTKGTSSEKAKRGRISSAQTLLQCIFVHQVTLLYNAANAKKGKSREEKFIANASKTRKSLEAEQKADLDELEADKTKKIADIEVTEARVRTEQPTNANTLVADYARQKLQIGADYLAKCKAVGTHWNGVWNERTVFHRARQNALKKKRETKERVTAITSVGFIGPVAPPPPAGAPVDCPESNGEAARSGDSDGVGAAQAAAQAPAPAPAPVPAGAVDIAASASWEQCAGMY